MSTKHFHPPSHPSLVLPALRALAHISPSLSLHTPSKTLLLRTLPAAVPILCGGGSGHEPFAAGYVSPGLLTAAVSGEVFASPSAAQILAAIRLLSPLNRGVLILHNNYTGDCLHFGLAAEHAHALGIPTRTVLQADDVSLPRARSLKLGRRGLAGIILTAKILSAASLPPSNLSLDELGTLGDIVVKHTATIGTGLDRCHLPNQPPEAWESLPGAAVEVGMGMHNEPGVRRVDAGLTAEEMVDEMLGLLLDASDEGRNYLPPFSPNDRPVILINNLGGLSPLELSALTSLVLTRLSAPPFSLPPPSRLYAGTYLTSLNSPAFSITILHVGAAQRALREGGLGVSVLEMLDREVDCPAWAGARGEYVGTPSPSGEE